MTSVSLKRLRIKQLSYRQRRRILIIKRNRLRIDRARRTQYQYSNKTEIDQVITPIRVTNSIQQIEQCSSLSTSFTPSSFLIDVPNSQHYSPLNNNEENLLSCNDTSLPFSKDYYCDSHYDDFYY